MSKDEGILLNPSLKATLSLLALAASLALTGCGEAKNEGAATAAPTVGVQTIQTQRVNIDTELSGRTTSYTMSDVRPQVDGIIQKRLFVEGSDVKAGQALYQIDPATYQAALDSAKAALAKAEANVVTLGLKAKRYHVLLAVHAVGQQDYDDALAAWKSAQADVLAERAAVESARINLNYTHVDAPISGRISKSAVTPGALVTANQSTALATIQQLDPIYVDVTRSNAELLQLKRELASGLLKSAGPNAAQVQLILEDGSVYPIKGTLQFSEVTVDESTGSIALRAIFSNPNHELLPGMYVRAQLVEGVNESAILVPQEAVSHDNKGNAIVMVVGEDNKATPRTLNLSHVINNQWLVQSGLKPGERIIVDGLQRVRSGQEVKPVPLADMPKTAQMASLR